MNKTQSSWRRKVVRGNMVIEIFYDRLEGKTYKDVYLNGVLRRSYTYHLSGVAECVCRDKNENVIDEYKIA